MLKIYKKWNFVYKACKGHICGKGCIKSVENFKTYY